MGRADVNQQEEHVPSAPPDLLMLLTTVATVDDESERARLVATAIPSFVSCSLSGMALRGDQAERWKPILQRDGRLVPLDKCDKLAADLDPIYREAVRRGSFLIAGANDPELADAIHWLATFNLQSLAAVPIATLRTEIGLLLVGRQPGESFSDDDEFLLRTLSQQLAISCENLRLREELQQHADELEVRVQERTKQLRASEEKQRVLLEINNAIIANLDRGSLFHAVSGALRTVVQFDRASLTIFDPGTDTLRVSALSRTSAEEKTLAEGSKFRRKGSHLQVVVDEQRPRIREELRAGSRTPQEDRLLNDGIRSYLAVPLVAKGKTIGTVNVGSKEPGHYSAADAEFLSEVASQIALAIENMVAYEEINRLKGQLEEENLYLREEIAPSVGFEDIVGRSSAMERVLESVTQVAGTDATVLITGETGTGKELIARAVHNNSDRQNKVLATVNCAALPAGLIESELFGHEKGAFTGALMRKTGRFEMAHEGTLFLDEIGDMPIELQAKLLRVLQDGEFERVGGDSVRVDVRVIAATNRDLNEDVQEHRFRPDLFYRLNVFPIQIPPLRERREDIRLLVPHFAINYAGKMGKQISSIPDTVIDSLMSYSWPGNVRELQNVIERAVIISQGTALELGEWPPSSSGPIPEAEAVTLVDVERNHILRVLNQTRWQVSGKDGAAAILGMKRSTLDSKMKKLGITRPA